MVATIYQPAGKCLQLLSHQKGVFQNFLGEALKQGLVDFVSF